MLRTLRIFHLSSAGHLRVQCVNDRPHITRDRVFQNRKLGLKNKHKISEKTPVISHFHSQMSFFVNRSPPQRAERRSRWCWRAPADTPMGLACPPRAVMWEVHLPNIDLLVQDWQHSIAEPLLALEGLSCQLSVAANDNEHKMCIIVLIRRYSLHVYTLYNWK